MSGFYAELQKHLALYFNLEKLAFYTVALLKIALILFVSYLVIKIIDRMVAQAIKVGRSRQDPINPRVATMTTLLQSVIMYIIYFIAGLMILQELGVHTSSILASAGILGVIVGFGAQNLVKDVIAGFFIILEDQYAVGDFVLIAEKTGQVTEIGLRSTRIADAGGEIHIIPNGTITKVTNLSRGNRKATVDLWISYQENLDRVLQVMQEVAAEAADQLDYIREGPSVLGIIEFRESYFLLRMTAITAPMRHDEAERELRRRIKKKFEAGDIRQLPGMSLTRGEQGGA